jgi:4-hydroxybutyrate CoA-transferase
MLVTADKALSVVKSGDRVFIHTAAAAPQVLVKALSARAPELRNVEIYHLHTEGEAPYADPALAGSFNFNSLFIGANVRKAINHGHGSYIPIFLSEAPLLFRRKIIPLDIALISVSPPDQHGYCSLGVSVDTTLAAIEMASIVIAQVNPQMPRTHGEGLIHKDRIDYLVEGDVPLPEAHLETPSAVELRIGQHVAGLIEDRATLQMGIGNIPNAVLASLGNHKDLGIHSEMFADGIIPLVESGVVTGKYKYRQKGKVVATFLVGTRKLYDFVDDNPVLTMMDCNYVNSTHVIRRHPRMTAINSAVEIDLTGQVCADSIGSRLYSGVGGQMDFIRGAALADGGKAIIALPSTTRRGESRIVPTLKEGAGVVTTRAHVHYIVTEYGVANLYGKSIKQRIKALIDIAHPDHRGRIEEEAHTKLGVPIGRPA